MNAQRSEFGGGTPAEGAQIVRQVSIRGTGREGAMGESAVGAFWEAHPCGDHMVGGLDARFGHDYERFFAEYDAWRYHHESHILGCLDGIDWRDRDVLEIGLGQGADSEQLIRRGARWSGLDLTQQSADHVGTRLGIRSLPHVALNKGSALEIPYDDNSFDLVCSHGVLHHIPDIRGAQSEIHRVLRPGGLLEAMLYARRSLSYQASIRLLRRGVMVAAFALRRTRVMSASRMLLAQRYMHAPPLPVHRMPGDHRLGWHLWAHLRVGLDDGPSTPAAPERTDGETAPTGGKR